MSTFPDDESESVGSHPSIIEPVGDQYDLTNTYDWDANGNPSGTQYTIGTGKRFESDGTWNFVYDDEGNLTKKTSVATGEQWEYFFDHANKLTKVEHRPNATSAVDKRIGCARFSLWFADGNSPGESILGGALSLLLSLLRRRRR